MYQTCYSHLDNAFDECIESEVSSAIKEMYNCTPPFFPYDGKRVIENLQPEDECKLNRFTKAERDEFRDTFLGLFQLTKLIL